jgi:IS5 family transposase
MKIDIAPTFAPLIDDGELKIVADYKNSYDKISDNLDKNPKILEMVHNDLVLWGSDSGRESTYSSEQLLRALLVKCIEGLSFRETIVRIADSTVLRNFTRVNSGKVMNFTVLDTAFKMIKPQTWDMINVVLKKQAITEGVIKGTRFRIDSTVCETNIHYPTDAFLLWDCYRVATSLMNQVREIEPVLLVGHRFHIEKVKALYTFIATHSNKKNKSTIRKVTKTTALLLHQTSTVVELARQVVLMGKKSVSLQVMTILAKLESYITDMDKVIIQATRSFNGESVPAKERIFSIFEPHTELLMRGKAHKPVEFGHLVQIGQVENKFISFYEVSDISLHDNEMLQVALDDHKAVFGTYPKECSADKNYYKSMDDIEEWEEEIDIFSVCKKGKRTEEEIAREHGYFFKLAQKFRAGCEGSISVLKRVFGLRRCLNRGFNSFAASIGCLVFCHNLVLLSKL